MLSIPPNGFNEEVTRGICMSKTFYLLSDMFQKKIWDMGWDRFTRVQDKTIPVIINTGKDVVISSGTASGKTEAAFLPILSIVEKTATKELNVLYISPLKALINNQFERIEKLCQESYIPIHRWHGDISGSRKKKLIDNPAGILQITPESIESLFINRTNELRFLFGNLKFIVVDEVHTFLDSDRGVHLRSLLSRITRFTKDKPRIIGLSATIESFALVKQWVNHRDTDNVEIIDVKGNEKDLFFYLMHFNACSNITKPVELYEDLRELTKYHDSLIFCNSRAEVEEATVFLNRLSEAEGKGRCYYAHHSSIDKREREFVEKTMASSTEPKSVIATSSLELGIDIGEIDYVIQIDDTFTVSSLKQRLGRSGRKRGADQYLQVYTTNNDSLVQSIAVIDLLLGKWTEPAKGYPLPYDILFHQIISICQEMNGIRVKDLVDIIKNNDAFYSLPEADIYYIINHMIEKEYLEQMKGSHELIVGLEGERLLRGKEFYSVFIAQDQFEVREGIKRIGSIDRNFLVSQGDNIILSGRLWTIIDIDFDRNKIYVKKAVDGKPPRYSSGGADLHPKIPKRMHEILCGDRRFEFIDANAQKHLEEQRHPFHYYEIVPNERVIWDEGAEMLFETYTGTRIFQTLVWMLRKYGIGIKEVDGIGRITIDGSCDLIGILEDMKKKDWSPNELLKYTSEKEMFVSKYSPYLPKAIQDKMHLAHRVDIEGVKTFLHNNTFRKIQVGQR